MSIEDHIKQYMSVVFGKNNPSLDSYIRFQGLHSEDEYEKELKYCMEKWPNDGGISIENYSLKIPRECSSWLAERSKHPLSSESLYYKSVRNIFKYYPIEYSIREIIKNENKYNVVVDMKTGGSMVLSISPSIDDQKSTSIYITNIFIP